MEQSRVDWPSFVLCAAILLFTSIPLMAYPEASSAYLEKTGSRLANTATSN